MLKKKILLLGLFLAGSVSGLRAQETNTINEYPFTSYKEIISTDIEKNSPTANLAWDDVQGCIVSNYEGLKYYRNLLSDETTVNPVLKTLTRGKNYGETVSYPEWLKQNPAPETSDPTYFDWYDSSEDAKDKYIKVWDERINKFKEARGILRINADFEISDKDFSFRTIYNNNVEGNVIGRYKIKYLFGQQHILTMPDEVREGTNNEYGNLLGINRYTEVYRLGIVHGSIRNTVDATKTYNSFDNPRPYVAGNVYTPENPIWRAAGETGEKSYSLEKDPMPEQGYNVRGTFGMMLYEEDENGNIIQDDVATRKFTSILGLPNAPDYRVFKAQYYDRTNCNNTDPDAHTFYTNLRVEDGTPVGNKTRREQKGYKPDTPEGRNGLLYIDDPEILSYGINTGGPGKNVVYKGAGTEGWVCNYAEFDVDSNVESSVYIWQDFRANKLSYKRAFTKKTTPVPVCLPFNLSANMQLNGATIYKLLSYDGYRTVNFEGEDTPAIWFRTKTDIAANTPCMVRFKNDGGDGSYLENLENVNVFASPNPNEESQKMCIKPESADGIGEHYGVHAYVSAGLLSNESNYLYTIKEDETTGKVTAQLLRDKGNGWPNIWPGRGYIRMDSKLPEASSQAGKIKVRFIDEDGNVESDDPTTGIEAVKGSAANVVGGVRTIEIDSEKAMNVRIYTVDGRMIKNIQVAAGQTSIPVAAGAYVVNGTKVIVK